MDLEAFDIQVFLFCKVDYSEGTRTLIGSKGPSLLKKLQHWAYGLPIMCWILFIGTVMLSSSLKIKT
jgi:hypothetical protein